MSLVPSQKHDAAEQLSGIVEKLTFHNDENGFTVLRIRLKGRSDLSTVVGVTALVRPGDHVECSGDWINNRLHGLQFRAERISLVPPTALDAIEKYLSSGMVNGVGGHYAKALVNAFGEHVFDVIENEPDRLAEVHGIGAKRRRLIIASWQEQKAVRDIMMFFQSHGIGPARAVRIYKVYGDQAITKVKHNPYALALDVQGIGFKISDSLAMSLGLAADSLIRARAGVRHVLQELSTSGHCAAYQEDLIVQAEKLLGIPVHTIEQAIELEVSAGRLINEDIKGRSCFFIAYLHQAEVSVANHLSRLMAGSVSWFNLHVDQALSQSKNDRNIQLSASQKVAVQCVLKSKVAVITGGPGVGKTTVVNTILHLVRSQGARVLLCAPTGRAAKRLSESSGVEAKTIHRLLEFEPHAMGFKRGIEFPLEADFVVVDEMSMVDIVLMRALLQAIPDSAGLLLVGDADQLPSVGPGSVLADIIASRRIVTTRLTEIFRQAAESDIIVNAHRINQGQQPLKHVNKDELSDFYFLSAETPDAIHDKLLHVVTERIPRRFNLHPLRDIQVLTPMNKGGLGTRSLNIELQEKLNPTDGPRIKRFGWTYALGDKVIQMVNNYDKDVFNGDIGFIEYIDSANGVLKINFEGRNIEYVANELDEISLAYATTIHKAQGSEYPAVVLPLSTQHYTMLERNLLYTGVTRGKRLVVIIGQEKALRLAVDNVRAAGRLTKLAERLSHDKDQNCAANK